MVQLINNLNNPIKPLLYLIKQSKQRQNEINLFFDN